MIRRKSAGSKPSPQEINMLVVLFNQGRYTEMETLALGKWDAFLIIGLGDALLHNNLGNA